MSTYTINCYATAMATVTIKAESAEAAVDAAINLAKPARILHAKSGLSIGFDQWVIEGAPVAVEA